MCECLSYETEYGRRTDLCEVCADTWEDMESGKYDERVRQHSLRDVRDWLKGHIEHIEDDNPPIDFSDPAEKAYVSALKETLEEFGPGGRFKIAEEGE